MENLNFQELGVIELTKEEKKAVDGGFILALMVAFGLGYWLGEAIFGKD